MRKDCWDCFYRDAGLADEPCISCQDGAPTMWRGMTNSDKIRQMSDEELARWIMYDNPCGGISEEKCHHYSGVEACIRCFCDWLKEEAQDG